MNMEFFQFMINNKRVKKPKLSDVIFVQTPSAVLNFYFQKYSLLLQPPNSQTARISPGAVCLLCFHLVLPLS